MTELSVHPIVAPDDACAAGAGGALMPRDRAEDLALVFKALADPVRVRLLEYLAGSQEGTACACHLPTALGITQPTLSHHLRRLREAGLVERERRGRWVHWTVRQAALERAGAFLGMAVASEADRCC